MARTYNFDISFDQDSDGRWSAWLTSYPACGTWGDTKDEAAEALAEMTLVFLEVMEDSGEIVHADSVDTHYSSGPVVASAVNYEGVASVGKDTIRIPTQV